MATTQTFPQAFLGTISHGTLRPQDLVAAFTEALDFLDPQGHTEFMLGYLDVVVGLDIVPWEDHSEDFLDRTHWALECLFERLDGLAPAGYYFGAIEGDGSDFGFWATYDDDFEDEEPDERDQFRDDVEADADVLRMAGFGTEEDYGYFGEDTYL